MRWLSPDRTPNVVRGGRSCPPRGMAGCLRGGQVCPPRKSAAILRVCGVLAALILATAGGCSSPGGDNILLTERGLWHRTGPVATYTANNLHEYIDGAAPFVISFGFESLQTAGYRRGAEPETTVDIYDMGSSDNAFALFRSNSNVEAGPLEVGTEGAGADARIEFWQGAYYVAVSNPSADEKDEVLALARDLAQALPVVGAWPAYLDLLPTAGRVVHSERFLPSDYLGHGFLKRAVSARYKVGAREMTLFACRLETPKEAAVAMGRLKAFLDKQGRAQALARGEGGYVAADSTLGRVAVFQRGQFVAGLYPYPEEPAADDLLADLDRRLGGR